MDPRAVPKPLWLLAGSGTDRLRALNVTLADVHRAVPREPGARDSCLPMIGTSRAPRECSVVGRVGHCCPCRRVGV